MSGEEKKSDNIAAAAAPIPADRKKRDKKEESATEGAMGGGKSKHTTSTPMPKVRATDCHTNVLSFSPTDFFTEKEWEKRKNFIKSRDPKEKGQDRVHLLEQFKRLLPEQDTRLEQENIESTWRSLHRCYFLIKYYLQTTTATREDSKQLKEMENQLGRFRIGLDGTVLLNDEYFNFKGNPNSAAKYARKLRDGEDKSVGFSTEDDLLKHAQATPSHIAQEDCVVKPRATSTGNDGMEPDDFMKKMENMEEEEKRKYLEIGMNNFLTLYKKQVEPVLQTNSAPEGFMDIFQQLQRTYYRIQMLYDGIAQTEDEQKDMTFVQQKYNEVKDHIAMLNQMDMDDLDEMPLYDFPLDEEPDPEVESILYEINEFANDHNYKFNSELAYLLCDWISQGGGDLRQYQRTELSELLWSFGKSRLEHVLHLWRSRLCETQSETHEQITHYLNNMLETWNELGPEDNGSMWAAHTSRFTRGNMPNATLKDRFSIFLDPVHEEHEGAHGGNDVDTDVSQQRNESPTQRASTPPQHGFALDGLRRIPTFVNQRNDFTFQGTSTPPPGIALRGLRRVPTFENRFHFAGPRANTTAQPSTIRQPPRTNDADPITRLANILQRNFSNNQSSGNHSTSNHSSALKLPPIQIGKFDGNPLNWVNWWPKYEALIHNRRDLEASTKFLYLQSYVTEKAAKELWGAGPETLPYHKAIEILFDKFADKELLTGVYRDQLKKIPFPKSARDIPGIRNFVDEVRKYMNCLREYKQMPEQYSLSTMDFYRASMPEELLHFIADKEDRRISHFSLMQFIAALAKYVDLREDTSRFREYVGGRNQNPSNPTTTMATGTRTFSRGQGGQNQSSRGSYPSGSTRPTNFNYYTCLFCEQKGVGGHLMMNCPTVKDPNERMKIIRKLQRCTCCLSQNHRFFECPSNKACFCMKKHHTSLHEWFVKKPGGNQPQGNRSNQQGARQYGQNQRGGQQPNGNRTQGNQNNSQRNRTQNQSAGNDTGRA